jgi:hypothetical protein
MSTKKHLKKIYKGFLVESYEIIFDRSKKTWQIWHPDYGFMAAYRDKDRAIDYCRTLAG